MITKKIQVSNGFPGFDDTSDATATSSDIRENETAYVKGQKITGNIPTKTSSDVTIDENTVSIPAGIYDDDVTKSVDTVTQAVPSVSVSSSGLITATATQSSGYVSAGTKSEVLQLATQDEQTITPTTSNQTISKDTYLTGVQTIAGDSDLVAGNIKSGVNIFGVDGTFTSDATADADDIVAPETAYVNGVKLTGTNPYEKVSTDNEVSTQTDLISQIEAALEERTSVAPALQDKVVAPTEASQIVVADAGYDGLSTVTVSAIDSAYVGSGVARQDAQTITPGTSDITIASDRYLTGSQTIKGDANLVAENIASGVSIFGVSGTYQTAPTVYTTYKSNSSNSTSIAFTGLAKEPIAFAVIATTQITLGTTRYVTSVWFDGSTVRGTYGYRSGSTAYQYVSNSYFSSTYSSGTLTVKTSSSTYGGYFQSGCVYYLFAVY